jgi:hypothetical protein
MDEELEGSREVVNHDANVLQPLNRHVLHRNKPRFELQRRARVEIGPSNDKSASQR